MITVEKRYIGDGVYAHFDGYHIWLTTLQGDQIAIEPEVMESLKKYQADLIEHFKVESK